MTGIQRTRSAGASRRLLLSSGLTRRAQALVALLAAALVLTPALPLPAQDGAADPLPSGLSTEDLSFDEAAISLAGPQSFYIRNIDTPEGRFAVRLSADGGAGSSAGSAGAGDPAVAVWQVVEVYPEERNILPRDVVLDTASLQTREDGTLRIDGVFLGDSVYRIDLRAATEGFRLIDGLRAGTLAAVDSDRAEPLIDLIVEDVAAEELAEAQRRIEELRAERDDALEKAQRLSARNMGLLEEVAALEEENSALTAARDSLRREVETLQQENRDLRERIAALSSGDGAGDGQPPAGDSRPTAPDDQPPAGDSRPTAPAGDTPDRDEEPSGGDGTEPPSREELRRLAAEAEELNTRLAEILDSLESLGGDLSAGQEELLAEIEALRSRAGTLQSEQDTLRETLLEEIARGRYVALRAQDLSRELSAGFDRGAGQIGVWRRSGNTLRQRDSEQYFAKYLLPLPQSSQETLYELRARSLDDGWVGLGLHIYVSNVDKRGYGLGDSLLIWFTRDPSVYGTRNTFLQVYRSSDDVNMGRVAGAMISEPIAEPLDIDILYEPARGYITVAVNGEDKIRYRAWFDITRGAEIAFRSLGRAEFSEFRVRTLRDSGE